MSGLRFSLVVPVFDEADNVDALLDEIAAVVVPLGPCECLVVDDGSRDQSLARLRAWKQRHDAPWLRIVSLARNRGQSAAVMAGVDRSRAPLVLMMDGDLQNDPRDFAAMLALLERGAADGVSGVRVRRRDSWLRRVSSRIGNAVRNAITADRVADSASGIKAFRREVLSGLPRFVGMHRFLPTLARYRGANVVEIPVNHRPRHAGKAKYGVGNRAWRGLKDCLAMRWLRQRMLDYQVQEEV
ncbi:MAG: glycosyltransferase family 2 protein [Planctomycetes bacterium]|nr:glycosyltransferase family 2 protein [Planctomycetota bacterium]